MTLQLSLFAPEDHADILARGFLALAWACVQARNRLTDQGYALMCGELALAHQRLDTITNPQLAVPALAEIRDRQRRRVAPRTAAALPVHFREDRPAWAARTEGSEP